MEINPIALCLIFWKKSKKSHYIDRVRLLLLFFLFQNFPISLYNFYFIALKSNLIIKYVGKFSYLGMECSRRTRPLPSFICRTTIVGAKELWESKNKVIHPKYSKPWHTQLIVCTVTLNCICVSLFKFHTYLNF